MPFKTVVGTDGSMRRVNLATGNTVEAFSQLGGRGKELTAASTLTEADNDLTFFLNAGTEFATTLPSPFLGARFTNDPRHARRLNKVLAIEAEAHNG